MLVLLTGACINFSLFEDINVDLPTLTSPDLAYYRIDVALEINKLPFYSTQCILLVPYIGSLTR